MLIQSVQIREDNPRILAIAKILSDQKPHKASDLASRLKISPGTVRRYLHFMRDEMQLPIESGTSGFFVRE